MLTLAKFMHKLVLSIFTTFLGGGYAVYSFYHPFQKRRKSQKGENYIPLFFFPSVDKTFKYLLHMLTYKMENPINAIDLATVSSWNCSQLV